jgi:hypothetical protein
MRKILIEMREASRAYEAKLTWQTVVSIAIVTAGMYFVRHGLP